MMPSITRNLALLFCAACLSGCASVHGPTAQAVRKSTEVEVVHIQCVTDIPCPPHFCFTIGLPKENPLRQYREELTPRDTITILITDSDPQSPFYRPGDSYKFGPVEVPSDGLIKAPYIGEFKASGKTLASLSSVISGKVQSVSSSADATVLRDRRISSTAGVIGEVNKPGQFELDREDFGSLDLLAAAGGGKEHPDSYLYKLERGGQCYCYTIKTFRNNPFPVEDGDLLTVEKDPCYAYYTMGQFDKPCRLPLRGPHTSVADAISESGGFADGKADPRGVFVFRKNDGSEKGGNQGYTAYVLDVQQASFPLLIQQFRICERDVVYASEAPLNQVSKTARAVAPIIGLGVATAAIESKL